MKIILMCVLRLSENTNKMQTESKKTKTRGKYTIKTCIPIHFVNTECGEIY